MSKWVDIVHGSGWKNTGVLPENQLCFHRAGVVKIYTPDAPGINMSHVIINNIGNNIIEVKFDQQDLREEDRNKIYCVMPGEKKLLITIECPFVIYWRNTKISP